MTTASDKDRYGPTGLLVGHHPKKVGEDTVELFVEPRGQPMTNVPYNGDDDEWAEYPDEPEEL